MSFFPIIFLTLPVLLIVDFLRCKAVVERELKRRDLVKIGNMGMRISPAKGLRLLEACICQREGKEYRVIIFNRGWVRTQPSLQITETSNAGVENKN